METNTQTPFMIDSEARAEWLLGKLAALDAEAERVSANAARRCAELQTDRAGLMHQFGDQLTAWARGEAEKRRRKTVTTLQGSVSFRIVPARLAVEDVELALASALAVCPEAVTTETVTRLDRGVLVKAATAYMEDTGLVLDGLDLVPASESVKITTSATFADARDRSSPEPARKAATADDE